MHVFGVHVSNFVVFFLGSCFTKQRQSPIQTQLMNTNKLASSKALLPYTCPLNGSKYNLLQQIRICCYIMCWLYVLYNSAYEPWVPPSQSKQLAPPTEIQEEFYQPHWGEITYGLHADYTDTQWTRAHMIIKELFPDWGNCPGKVRWVFGGFTLLKGTPAPHCLELALPLMKSHIKNFSFNIVM